MAVLVAGIGEVLARHTDARRPGALQTINEVPFLFRHRSLHVNSTSVLVMDGRVWSRVKTEELARGVETFKFRQVMRKTTATAFLPCRNTLSKCAIVPTEIRQGSHGDLGLLEDQHR